MDVPIARPVEPVPTFVLPQFGGILELLFRDVDLIAAELLVVSQERPGNRIVIRADSKDSAETHDGIGHPARDLIDHEALDLADALAFRIIDRSALDLVACDQRYRLLVINSRVAYLQPCQPPGSSGITLPYLGRSRMPAPGHRDDDDDQLSNLLLSTRRVGRAAAGCGRMLSHDAAC
jgi:hypothetical protein